MLCARRPSSAATVAVYRRSIATSFQPITSRMSESFMPRRFTCTPKIGAAPGCTRGTSENLLRVYHRNSGYGGGRRVHSTVSKISSERTKSAVIYSRDWDRNTPHVQVSRTRGVHHDPLSAKHRNRVSVALGRWRACTGVLRDLYGGSGERGD